MTKETVNSSTREVTLIGPGAVVFGGFLYLMGHVGAAWLFFAMGFLIFVHGVKTLMFSRRPARNDNKQKYNDDSLFMHVLCEKLQEQNSMNRSKFAVNKTGIAHGRNSGDPSAT